MNRNDKNHLKLLKVQSKWKVNIKHKLTKQFSINKKKTLNTKH